MTKVPEMMQDMM